MPSRTRRAPHIRPRADRVLAPLLALALTLIAGAAMAMDELQFFRIATAATTGTYFQIGGVLASAITKPAGSRDCVHGGSCGVAGLVAIAQASQGSIQNVLAVAGGQTESGLVQSDIAYWAYVGSTVAPRNCGKGLGEVARGTPGMTLLAAGGRRQDLRAIAGLYPEDVHIVVRRDSSITELSDLKGKRVALGEPESGTLADAIVVLEAAGLSECDLDAQYLRLAEASAALIEGRIDAFFMVAGYPVPAITDVAAAVPTRLLPLRRDIVDGLAAQYPFFKADVIPGGSYPGVAEDTPTIGTTALWVTRADMGDDLIYAITKSLWSDGTKRLLEGAHPVGRRIRLASALDGVAIPLHPGAARFYREAGLRRAEVQ